MSKKPVRSAQELEQQLGELTQALQRERADALNLRRRTEEERARLGDFYKVLIVRELLPAFDSLERALKHAPRELINHEYVKGVQAVAKEFEKSLEKLGVEHIKTVGELFDPHLHEAMSVHGSDSGVEVVCEELQPGYKLGNEIIRHALVKVKKQGPSKPAGEVGEKK